MLIVVDANVVFSALMKSGGNPSKVFESNRISGQFEFVAPEFIFFEIDGKMGRLVSKSGLTKEEVSEALALIRRDIRLVSFSEFSDKLPEAIKLNFKDSPYLALALKLKCPIFSGDKGLKKQALVEVLSPRELLDKLPAP